MMRIMKLVHLFGLTLFLGSIITFVSISILTKDASVTDIAFGRQIISNGTTILTLPGIWLLAISGIWNGLKRYGLRNRYVQIKLLLIFIIIFNAYLFVVPAATEATKLAIQSISHGQLYSEFANAYLKESIMGGINVILGVVASIIGVWETTGKMS